MMINVVKGTSSSKGAPSSKNAPNVLHFVLERRWLGLDEKAQKKSLGCRKLTGPVMEGWAIRVRAVYKSKAKAEKALAAALSAQTEVEREGGLRERAQLEVKAYEVAGQSDGSIASEPGHPAWENGALTRCIYAVSSSVGECFSSQDLPPGLVEFDGNYFYMSAEHETKAKKLEEQRGSPWGYPHNAGILCARPGEVLKVFSSPVGDRGANAYATGQGLKDLQIPDFASLHNYDLGKAVTYSKGGLAQVKLHRADKGNSIRGLVTVSEHKILDYRPPPTPMSTKSTKSDS